MSMSTLYLLILLSHTEDRGKVFQLTDMFATYPNTPCLGVQACLRRVKDLKNKRPLRKPLGSALLSCLRRVKYLEKRRPRINE